jgi:hypothetical protein
MERSSEDLKDGAFGEGRVDGQGTPHPPWMKQKRDIRNSYGMRWF